MSGLKTDLYQLTMAQGYFEKGRHEQNAVFEKDSSVFFGHLIASRLGFYHPGSENPSKDIHLGFPHYSTDRALLSLAFKKPAKNISIIPALPASLY